jgi:hypothetical protein
MHSYTSSTVEQKGSFAMHITSVVKRAFAGCAIAAFACMSLGAMPGAHAAAAKATFVDSSKTYSLTYPANWTRTKQARYDLYVNSPDMNVLVIATSTRTSAPGPAQIKQDLPRLVRYVGTPAGTPLYRSHRVHGIPVYSGLVPYKANSGRIGVVLLEEAYTGGRFYLVAAVELDATAPNATDDTNQAVATVTSLDLQPSVLDSPSG